MNQNDSSLDQVIANQPPINLSKTATNEWKFFNDTLDSSDQSSPLFLQVKAYPHWMELDFLLAFIISCLLGVAINWLAIWCTEVNSPLTTSVVGVIKVRRGRLSWPSRLWHFCTSVGEMSESRSLIYCAAAIIPQVFSNGTKVLSVIEIGFFGEFYSPFEDNIHWILTESFSKFTYWN